MAKFRTVNLNVPADTTESDPLKKAPDAACSVYVTGTFVATLQLQVSLDGTNWLNNGSAITAPGVLTASVNAPWVRVDVTTYTSGTPVGVALVS